jgi:sirohydrochlorin cobaltochelatase
VKPPLLLAAHGTRDQAGVAAFASFAQRVGVLAARDDVLVAGGFIELSPPPLCDAVAGLVAAGASRRIVAVPLMLSAAGHAKGDIPAALARERDRHPGLTWHYGRPLGPHPVLLELLAARIRAVAEATAAVLVVGRGSTDPDANADVVKTARLLWEGREFSLAETAFVSLARPDVTGGLERCRLLGASRIVVAKYFLFPGVLPDRISEQAADYARAHPELDIRCTDVLGDCAELAGLVYERYQEAASAGGDIRGNCDMCVYRVAMPGFEHRVGEPQHPHDHPHDHVHAHA